MAIIIYILGTIGLLIAIVLIIAMFVKKSYEISRSIVIGQPKQAVFDYVKLVKNSENFSKWVMLDPNSRRQMQGIDGTPGFIYAWDSDIKNVGKGEQEIKSIADGQRIDYEIRFLSHLMEKPMHPSLPKPKQAKAPK